MVTLAHRIQQVEAAARFLATDTGTLLTLDVSRHDLHADLLADVQAGFASAGRRSLPPKYFYDAVGSDLFEAITTLPEYYPTRTEAALLRQQAGEIWALTRPTQLVELGSGSATKTRLLFDAYPTQAPLTYIPIDVSQTMLASTAIQLVGDYPWLRVLALAGTFEDALAVLPGHGRRLFLFLGGTLGNLTAEQQGEFFDRLIDRMQPGNQLLLGFDRRAHAGKPAARIVAAYNDAAGVTAHFNRNLLSRLNRDLQADFQLEAWAHRAIYNAERHQIEMYLDCLDDQTVTIPALGARYEFRRGESLLTELSRKFDPDELSAWFASKGLLTSASWQDAQNQYGLLLLERS